MSLVLIVCFLGHSFEQATQDRICVAKESRTIIRQHLDAHKWHQSAFSTEQFKGARWLLTAADLRKCLTVTPQSQVLHLCLVIKTFLDGGRRLRPSARSKARLSPSEFDKLCDFSCIYSYIWGEAKLLTSWTPEKDAAMEKAFFQKIPSEVNTF